MEGLRRELLLSLSGEELAAVSKQCQYLLWCSERRAQQPQVMGSSRVVKAHMEYLNSTILALVALLTTKPHSGILKEFPAIMAEFVNHCFGDLVPPSQLSKGDIVDLLQYYPFLPICSEIQTAKWSNDTLLLELSPCVFQARDESFCKFSRALMANLVKKLFPDKRLTFETDMGTRALGKCSFKVTVSRYTHVQILRIR